MPVDPSISLDVTGGSSGPMQPGNSASANPLAAASSYAGIAQQMNQLKLFNATMAARQKAGQIMASAPDAATGQSLLSQDPEVTKYLPELPAQIGSGLNQLQQLRGQIQVQTGDAFNRVTSVLPAGLADPFSIGPAGDAMIANIADPNIKANVLKSWNNIKTSLIDGLVPNPNNDPKIAKANTDEYTKRLTALGIGTGSLDNISKLSPQLGQINEGTQVQPGVVASPVNNLLNAGAPPGTFTPRGNPLAIGVPSGSSVQSAAEAQSIGSKAGEIQDDMQKNASNLPTAIKRLDMMNEALSQFQAGGGAITRANIGKIMQGLKNIGLPISDDSIKGVANDSLPASQLFMKYVTPYVTAEMRDNATAGSTAVASTVNGYLKMMDASTDPVAIMKMLNSSRYALQLGYQQAQQWPEFKAAVRAGKLPGYDLGDYYAYFDKNLAPKNLPAQTPGGLQLGPVGGAKGTEPSSVDMDKVKAAMKKYLPASSTP